MRTATLKQVAGLSVGLLVLAFLVHRTTTARILQYLANLGPGLVVPIALVGAQHMIRSLSWLIALRASGQPLAYGHVLRARLAAEALGYVSMTGAVGGQTGKVWLLREGVPPSAGAAAVLVDALAVAVAGSLFTGAAMLIVQWRLALPAWMAAIGGALVSLALVGWVLAGLWSGQRERRGPDPARILTAPPPSGWRRGARDALRRVGAALVRLRGLPFAGMILLHLLGHTALTAATWWIVGSLGIGWRPALGLLFEVGGKAGNVAGALVPARLGIFEAGVAAAADLLELEIAAGVAVGLVRRLIDLLWVGSGLLILVLAPPRATPHPYESPGSEDGTSAASRRKRNR